MASVRTLIRRKVRLTRWLVRSDHRRYDKSKPVREKRLLRARLYRIDLLLEQAGEFPGHTWYPYARRDPGLNAGYRRGRSLMRQMRVHYTVGTASGPLIRDKGLAPFLIDRDGTINEYAEADSVCGDACEWNPLGFGVEVEARDRGQFTPEQIVSLSNLWGWAHGTYAIPDEWHLGPDYDGSPRAPVGSDARGVYNHDALDERKCDRHFDGATPAERDAIRGSSSTPEAPKDSNMKVVAFNVPGTGVLTYLVDGFLVKQFPSTPAGAFGISEAGSQFAASAGLGPVVVLGKDELDKYAANAPGAVKTFLAKLFPAKAARAA